MREKYPKPWLNSCVQRTYMRISNAAHTQTQGWAGIISRLQSVPRHKDNHYPWLRSKVLIFLVLNLHMYVEKVPYK